MIIARSGEPMAGAATDSPCYRIPALAVMGERMLLAYDVRASALDLPGVNGMAIRHADDAAASWSPPRWLRSPEPGWGCGDASFIVDGDEVLCWYVGSRGLSFWDDSRPGQGWQVWLARSSDGGLTWAHDDRSGEIWPGWAGSLFPTSGNGIRLSSGRLAQPFVFREAGGDGRVAALALSDDHGQTWRLGEAVAGADESKCVELPDGRLVLHSRARPHRLVAFSSDGGETFDAPQPDLPDPGCNGGLTALPDGQLACTLVHPDGVPGEAFTLPDPTGGRGTHSGPDWSARRNLVLRVGRPGDWGEPHTVDPGPAAYSVCQALPDGRVAVAWEFGAYEGIRFTVASSSSVSSGST